MMSHSLLLLLSLLSCPLPSSQARRARRARRAGAEQENLEGISLGEAGRLGEALGHFHEAIRLSGGTDRPTRGSTTAQRAAYRNNLGVTEMRLGLYSLALERFYDALRADAGNADAPKHIATAKDLEAHEDGRGGVTPFLTGPRLHALRRLPRLRLANRVDWDGPLVAQLASGLEPFVLELAVPPPPPRRRHRWQRLLTGLAERFGHLDVEYYPHAMLREGVAPVFHPAPMALRDIAACIRLGADLGSRGGAARHQHPRRREQGRHLTVEEALAAGIAPGRARYLHANLAPEDWDAALALPLEFWHAAGTAEGGLDHDQGRGQDRARQQNGPQGPVEMDRQRAPRHGRLDLGSLLKRLPQLLRDLLVPADADALPCLTRTAAVRSFMASTHWRMLLVGTPGAGMFNHQDLLLASSWQAQLAGTKHWHLCPAGEANDSLYGAGIVNAFDPDYATFPLVRNARCFQDVVGPGEIIYYPGSYWHQTISSPFAGTGLAKESGADDGEEDGEGEMSSPLSVSLSGTVLTDHNAQAVGQLLARQCRGGGRIHVPADVCADILRPDDGCLAAWTTRWHQRRLGSRAASGGRRRGSGGGCDGAGRSSSTTEAPLDAASGETCPTRADP